MNKSLPPYIRHSIVPLDEGLRAIAQGVGQARNFKVILNGLAIKCTSLRLRTFFHKGQCCASCGLKASYFALEDHGKAPKQPKSYHMNMWGVAEDGSEVLFTHDHILARGLGGDDVLDNAQTMCCYCNWAKGELESISCKNRRNDACGDTEDTAVPGVERVPTGTV